MGEFAKFNLKSLPRVADHPDHVSHPTGTFAKFPKQKIEQSISDQLDCRVTGETAEFT
jgi:hypothetical protein